MKDNEPIPEDYYLEFSPFKPEEAKEAMTFSPCEMNCTEETVEIGHCMCYREHHTRKELQSLRDQLAAKEDELNTEQHLVRVKQKLLDCAKEAHAKEIQQLKEQLAAKEKDEPHAKKMIQIVSDKRNLLTDTEKDLWRSVFYKDQEIQQQAQRIKELEEALTYMISCSDDFKNYDYHKVAKARKLLLLKNV